MAEKEKHKGVWVRGAWQATGIMLVAVVAGLLLNQIRSQGIPMVADWSPEARLTLESGENIATSLEKAVSEFALTIRRNASIFPNGNI